MKINIDNELKELVEGATLLVLTYDVEVKKSSKQLISCLDQNIAKLESEYEVADIASLEQIQNTRAAYKALGKSPSSYRNAAEAMLRRIVKVNGLYNINNVVEINNIMSITTGFSIGSYDMDCIGDEITWKKAPAGEVYKGIGKDDVNIEFLPTLYDQEGAFGNPTSDSRRAMIQKGEKRVMSVVYSFDGSQALEQVSNEYVRLLTEFCDVENIEVQVIS